MKIIALAVVLPLVALGCGTGTAGSDDATADASGDAAGSTASTGAELAGSSWVLTGLDRMDASDTGTEVQGGAELTLTFGEDGAAFGSTGCNRFTATWTQEAATVSISVGAVTQAACANDALTEQERTYLQVLDAVETAEVGGATLRLLAGDEGALQFEAAIDDLAGTAWQATGVNNQTGGVESSALTPSVTAEFGADGTLTGFSGCRDYAATYEASRGSISVTDVVLDGPECSGDEARLESSYVQALANASTFMVEGSTLNLRDSEGATQVNYSLRS